MIEDIINRLYNWKFNSALNDAKKIQKEVKLTPKVMEFLTLLSKKYGNIGWVEGKISNTIRKEVNHAAKLLGFVYNEKHDYYYFFLNGVILPTPKEKKRKTSLTIENVDIVLDKDFYKTISTSPQQTTGDLAQIFLMELQKHIKTLPTPFNNVQFKFDKGIKVTMNIN